MTNLRMFATFASGQTFLVALLLFETVEALCCVKVELIPTDHWWQTEESLHQLNLGERVANKSI